MTTTELAPDEIQLFPPRAAKPRPEIKITDLSFVADLPATAKKPKRRTFWKVKPTNDYEADCATGDRLAAEYLAYTKSVDGGAPILSWIVADMPRKLSGIEIGFLSTIAWAAS